MGAEKGLSVDEELGGSVPLGEVHHDVDVGPPTVDVIALSGGAWFRSDVHDNSRSAGDVKEALDLHDDGFNAGDVIDVVAVCVNGFVGELVLFFGDVRAPDGVVLEDANGISKMDRLLEVGGVIVPEREDVSSGGVEEASWPIPAC